MNEGRFKKADQAQMEERQQIYIKIISIKTKSNGKKKNNI